MTEIERRLIVLADERAAPDSSIDITANVRKHSETSWLDWDHYLPAEIVETWVDLPLSAKLIAYYFADLRRYEAGSVD